MSGKRITTHQVKLFMKGRAEGQTQGRRPGRRRGMSERSARRVEGAEASAAVCRERHWRTRKDPFAAVWDSEIVPLLEQRPALTATTLFEGAAGALPGAVRQ